MAITFTELTGAATTTDATTIVTASIAVTINVPVILLIGNTKASAPDAISGITDDAAGGTNTYTGIRSRQYGSSAAPVVRTTAYIMIPKATESVVITVAFSGNTQTGLFHSIIDCAGADPSGTIVNSYGAFNDSSASNFDGQFSMSAFGASANLGLVIISHKANEATTKGATSTLIRSGSFATPTVGFVSEYSDSSELAPTASWGSSVQAGGIAIEVKNLASGGGVVGSSTRLRSLRRRRR